jgi:TfoX/Sxy family transcriptional regulator of competence genes
MVKRVPAAYNTPGKSQVVERLRCRAANLRLSKDWKRRSKRRWSGVRESVNGGINMAYSESLARRIRQIVARRRGITEKKMFGGICYLLHGNMCVGVWKDSLIARLGSERGDKALLEPHVKKMDITGKPMKGWVLVEPDGVESDERLSNWIEQAIEFVRTLPQKQK